MAAIKRHKVLLDQSAAGNGNWIRLDSRYDCDNERAIQIAMNAADTITIEGTTVDVRGSKPATVLASLTADDITVLATYTGNAQESDLVLGNWSYIRAVKTGATGNAKVQGFV